MKCYECEKNRDTGTMFVLGGAANKAVCTECMVRAYNWLHDRLTEQIAAETTTLKMTVRLMQYIGELEAAGDAMAHFEKGTSLGNAWVEARNKKP